MIKLASYNVFDELGGVEGQQFMVRLGRMPGIEIPALAAVVGIKRASDILNGWKAIVVPPANEEFATVVKQQPTVKKWAAYGSELTRHTAATYTYSRKVQEKEAELKALKEKERTNGTAIMVPGQNTQDFKVEIVKPFIDSLPF